MYYYEILNAPEFAMRILGEALFEAKEEFAGFKRKASEQELKEFLDTQKTVEHNIEVFKKELAEIAKETN